MVVTLTEPGPLGVSFAGTWPAIHSVLPGTQAAGATKFSDEPRDCLRPSRANCPVHVYAEAKSTLSTLGGAPFGEAAVARLLQNLLGDPGKSEL